MLEDPAHVGQLQEALRCNRPVGLLDKHSSSRNTDLPAFLPKLQPNNYTELSRHPAPWYRPLPEVTKEDFSLKVLTCNQIIQNPSTMSAIKSATLACAGVGTVGVVLLAAPMAAVAPALGLAGFSSGGIVGGSIAAGAQAGIGSVAAGSTFATLQSAAMGGYGVAAVAGVVQAIGGVIAGAAGGIAAWVQSEGPDEVME